MLDGSPVKPLPSFKADLWNGEKTFDFDSRDQPAKHYPPTKV